MTGVQTCALPIWQSIALEPSTALLVKAKREEIQPSLFPLTEGETIVADYAHLGLTLQRHPLALLRSRLTRMKLMSSQDLKQAPNGKRIHTVGLVTCRQRPASASGVTFVTLEDEDGNSNIVVWRDLAEQQRRPLLGAQLLGVEGIVERKGEVVHVVAKRLIDHSRLLAGLRVNSHDFR